MARIKKTATSRHDATLSPAISKFVQTASTIPLYQLADHLSSFPKLWPFSRGDLYHWIPVLNRFDRILQLFADEYGLSKGPQSQPFGVIILQQGDHNDEDSLGSSIKPEDGDLTARGFSADGDRELVERVLGFTRFLLENCGNRSLYSSSGHLSCLLNTTSVSLLKATLRLSLRLAQRYYSSRMRMASAAAQNSMLASHYNINLENVLKIALPFSRASAAAAPNAVSGKGKEKAAPSSAPKPRSSVEPSDLVALVKGQADGENLEQSFGGVHMTFYESSSDSSKVDPRSGHSEELPPNSPVSPSPLRRTTSAGSSHSARRSQGNPFDEGQSQQNLAGPPNQDKTGASTSKTIELSPSEVAASTVVEIVNTHVSKLPETFKYEFLNKVRTAAAISGARESREDIVAVRLLAIANLVYVHTDVTFHEKILLQDSDEPRRLQLAYQLSELVQPPANGEKPISTELQTCVLLTLEALARHKSRAPDVSTALSVNVNHGVLFYIVRKAVAELGVEGVEEDSQAEDAWREALFSLLTGLPSSQSRTGESMVSAGLFEILVEILTLRTKQAERNHPRVLNFLDTFVYNVRDAFQALVNAKGLDILTELVAFEVRESMEKAERGEGMPQDFKTQLTDYQIPWHHQQTLRWVCKFMNHMMSHSGTNFDRLLRNLIDSPQLLNSIRLIILNSTVFGSVVWSSAVNILTHFIHNEPTSYPVIAEAGLSKAFLEAVSDEAVPYLGPDSTSGAEDAGSKKPEERVLAAGIRPAPESMSAIPQAFGAICLNESGMAMFQESAALERFFEIYQSPEHVRALESDREVATVIGSHFDELVRHHPALKKSVLVAVNNMVKKVSALCMRKTLQHGIGAKLWIEGENGEVLVSGGLDALRGEEGPLHQRKRLELENLRDAEGEDTEMADVPHAADAVQVTTDKVLEIEDPKDGVTTFEYISNACRFLNGFLTNSSLTSAYVETNGVDYILDFATLPCLPHNLDNDSPVLVLSHVIQQLVEQKPHLTLPSLIKRSQRALDRLSPFLHHSGNRSFFASLTDPNMSVRDKSVLENGTAYLKALITVHNLVRILGFTFRHQMFNQRGSTNLFMQVNLADMYARLVESLGRLHRSCVWEDVLLHRDNISREWDAVAKESSLNAGVNDAAELLQRRFHSPARREPASEGGSGEQSGSNSNGTSGTEAAAPAAVTKTEGVYFKNSEILRHLLSNIPECIISFLQSLAKLLLFRRHTDGYQKQCSVLVADQIAKAAIEQLSFDPPKQTSSAKERHPYWLVILSSVLRLLVDDSMERGFSQTLTLVLLSFRNQGGIQSLETILDSFVDEAKSIISQEKSQEPNADGQALLNIVLGGIRIILALFSKIVNAKSLTEATQSISLQSRPDREREKPDFFLPGQFLVELRVAVVKPVGNIWNSDLLERATAPMVKALVEALKTILEGEGENNAFKRSDKPLSRSKPAVKSWRMKKEDDLQKLITDDKYDRDLALEALYRCSDSLAMAREYCAAFASHDRFDRSPIPSYEVVVAPDPANLIEESEHIGLSAMENVTENDPMGESVVMEDAAEATEQEQTPATQASSSRHALPIIVESVPQPLAGPSLFSGKSLVDDQVTTIEDLDEERAALRKNLIDRCIDVLNTHDTVTFELSDLIHATVAKASDQSALRSEIGSTLVQSLVSLQTGDDLMAVGKKAAALAHLLALVIQSEKFQNFYEATVDELKENFASLLEFVKIYPTHDSADMVSDWVGPILLIIEKLLSDDAQPHQIKWTPPNSDAEVVEQPVAELPEPVVSFENKERTFTAILEILPKIGKNESLALSVVRVLVILTKNREMASRLGEKRNIQRLFLMVKQLAGIPSDRLQGAFMLILRHIIEDHETIRQIMRSEIQAVFESRDRRQTDTTTYISQMYHLALRAPELFVEVTNEKLVLLRWEPNQRPQFLTLKKEEPANETETNGETSRPEGEDDVPREEAVKPTTESQASVGEKGKSPETKHPVVENPDGVIHYLLCELLAYKDVDDKEQPPPKPKPKAIEDKSADVDMSNGDDATSSASNEAAASEGSKSEKVEFKAEQHPIYIYRCTIIHCLTELLACYNRTKVEFINFSRKADPLTFTPSKPRSGVLNYLLNTLVPVGTLEHRDIFVGDLGFKKKLNTSNWAISLIVSLCAKTGEFNQGKDREGKDSEDEPELVFVRKFVLEQALKAFRDASGSNESLDAKYSRLLTLSDLFNRMLSSKATSNMANSDLLANSQKRLAKMMCEKNFISALTSAIADIDLNFPNAKRAVKYILRPLRVLTSAALHLTYSSDFAPSQNNEDEISSAASSVSDIDDREQTPDLFRNSTLAMFEPARDDETDSESSEEEEEGVFEVEYGDEMEYDEDMGHDNGDVISDDEEDMEDIGPVEGLPGDIPLNHTLVIDEDGEEMSEDDEEDSDDDEDEDDEDEDDDDDNDDEMEEIDDEITDEGEIASIEDEEDGWASDEDDGVDYPGPDDLEDNVRSSAPSALDHIVRVLEGEEDGNLLDMQSGELDMENGDQDDFLEDEMGDEDEDEEDEAEVIDEGGFVVNEDGEDEDDGAEEDDMWGIARDMPTGFHQVHHIHHHHQHAFGARANDWIFNRATIRTGPPPGAGQRQADDGVNPLLQRSGRQNSATPSGQGARHISLDFLNADPLRAGRMFQGADGGPVSFIHSLLNHINTPLHHHGGPVHLSLEGLPPIAAPPIMGRFGEPFRAEIINRNTDHILRPRDDPTQAVHFTPRKTLDRWQEEARVLFGPEVLDKAKRVANSILKLLVPPAIVAGKLKAKQQAEKLEKERKEREEREAQEKKEREEREEKEKKEREEREAAEAEAAAQRAREEAAEAERAREDVEEPAAEEQPMEGVEETQPPESVETGEAGPSEATPRVMATIRGRELDITGLGIDLEYLDALPEDLREEVLMQQVTERRSQAAAAGEEPTDISQEFLDALPADIRDELLQQEAQDRRRRERDEARRRAAATVGDQPPTARAEEMDAASFFASLEPGLRQAVLMDQDEDVLAQLPTDIAIEARALSSDRRLHQFADLTRFGRATIPERAVQGDDQAQRNKPRPVVQMLDKSGVATLLRLMFIPQQGSFRSTLHDILRHVCQNRQNRAEVINILLSILQDCSADATAMEKSFAQLSLRARTPSSHKTPQFLKRTTSGQPLSVSDIHPLMVVQQCLNLLVALTSYNPHIPSFFLSEHDLVSGSKSKSSRKGKMKENRASRYPLNALLSLLDRKPIIETSSSMEQLAHLLENITHPLSTVLKREKEKLERAEQSQAAGNSEASAAQETSQAAPETSQAAPSASAESQAPQMETGESQSTLPPPSGGQEAQVSAPETPAPAQAGADTQGADAQGTDAQGADAQGADAEGADAPSMEVDATGEGSSSTKESQKKESEEKPKKTKQFVPPEVPDHNLRLVVNILAARECSSKTFRDTLSVINNLSAIPGAREVFGLELVKQAQDLGVSILSDLEELLVQISNARSGTDVQGLALSKFSPASSDQAKLLRALTALDYLFDPQRAEGGDKPSNSVPEGLAKEQKDDIITTLYENPRFSSLWNKLSECLTAIRQRGNMFSVATILLPLIEVLMVVCRNTTLKDTPPSKPISSQLSVSSPAPESRLESLFFTFTEEHRKILNELVRHNPKLMSGSFSLLVKNSKVLEFDNKRNFFKRRLHTRNTEIRHPHPPLQLSLRRELVFLDSFKSLYFKSGDEMKYGKLSIRFSGEEGVDAGGVTREWFQVLARQMFDPNYALFTPVASDRTTFHPNSKSSINPEHLLFFKFVGRIIGKALYEDRVLDCHFSRAVYKRILGKPVSIKDMETLDLDYYKSLLWMLENDITDVITETFSVEEDSFGQHETIDLKENGRNIPVTEENKQEYVRLMIEYRLTGSIQEQLENFLKGFHDIVPPELIRIFNEQELELLISGLPDIEVDDWKNNTEYHNYTAASSQIQWFWRAVRSFVKEESAKLLQFVTGTSKVPLNGFKELQGMNGFSRFNIHRDYGSKDRLPSSHTCFNQLDLPEYESYEALRQQLYTAMTAGSEYFGFA